MRAAENLRRLPRDDVINDAHAHRSLRSTCSFT